MSNENGNGNHRNGHAKGSANGSANGHQNGNSDGHIPTNGVSRNGNGHHGAESIPTHDLLWDSLHASITDKLGQPLDTSLVSQRRGRGNRSVSYLEGRTVIDQANRIFGHGGWGHEVVGDVVLRDLDQVNTQTGEVRRIRAYSATVKVTVPGAPPRTDVGFQPVADETVEGHETAFKGAVTDALKRALRTFGAQFGNSPLRRRGGPAGRRRRRHPGPGPAQDTAGPGRLARGSTRSGSARRCGARRARTWTSCPPRSSRPWWSGPPGRCSSGRTPRRQPGGGETVAPPRHHQPRQRGRLHSGAAPILIYRTRRQGNDWNQDAHPLGLSPGHRGDGRGNLAGLHRRTRRAEAQPRAVGGTPRRGAGTLSST